jgi:hypothetical protein
MTECEILVQLNDDNSPSRPSAIHTDCKCDDEQIENLLFECMPGRISSDVAVCGVTTLSVFQGLYLTVSPANNLVNVPTCFVAIRESSSLFVACSETRNSLTHATQQQVSITYHSLWFQSSSRVLLRLGSFTNDVTFLISRDWCIGERPKLDLI